MSQSAAAQRTVDTSFTYYAPKGNQAERYSRLRNEARALAQRLITLCPACDERDTALTKLRECIMWANAAIAVSERATDGIIPLD